MTAPVDERCDCCDLPAYSCGRTIEREQRLQAARDSANLIVRGAHTAAWRGVCSGCGDWFAAGALILRDDRTDGWRAECCA